MDTLPKIKWRIESRIRMKFKYFVFRSAESVFSLARLLPTSRSPSSSRSRLDDISWDDWIWIQKISVNSIRECHSSYESHMFCWLNKSIARYFTREVFIYRATSGCAPRSLPSRTLPSSSNSIRNSRRPLPMAENTCEYGTRVIVE